MKYQTQSFNEFDIVKPENKFFRLLNGIPAMFYQINAAWSFELVHNSEIICKYKKGKLLSNQVNWLDLMHPDDHDRVLRGVRDLLGNPQTITQKYRIIDAYGKVHWVNDHKTSIFNPQDEFMGINGVLVDFTEHRRIEEALENRLMALSKPLSKDSKFLFNQLFNLNEIQELQNHIADTTRLCSIIVTPDGWSITKPSNFSRLASLVNNTPEGRNYCRESYKKLGQSDKNEPLFNDCEGLGVLNAGAPITIGGVHLATWIIGQVRSQQSSAEGIIQFAKKLNIDGDDLISAYKELPILSRPRFEKIAKTVFLIAEKLSQLAYQNVQHSRFVNEKEKSIRKYSSYEKHQELARNMEILGELSYSIAHDLNNLFVPIMSYSEILKKNLKTDEKYHHYVKNLAESAKKAHELINRILAFSSQEAFNRESIDINMIVQEFKPIVNKIIHEDTEIEFHLQNTLPSIKADQNSIGQIIVNLAKNAQEAIKKGGRIEIRTKLLEIKDGRGGEFHTIEPGIYVTLSIKDTGCGIHDDIKNNIFTPYFSTKGDIGTGMGLANVYKILEMHQAHIKIGSKPKRGTKITLFFPVLQEDIISNNDRKQSREFIKNINKVLIVDDNKFVLSTLRDFLTQEKFDVIVAKNGAEALDIIKEPNQNIDLILTDIVMPEMNGEQLHNAVSQYLPDIKTIFISGYPKAVLDEYYLENPDIDCLHKPFSTSELLDKIENIDN